MANVAPQMQMPMQAAPQMMQAAPQMQQPMQMQAEQVVRHFKFNFKCIKHSYVNLKSLSVFL